MAITGTRFTTSVIDTGNDHLITLVTASNEAADRTLTIPALGGNDTLMTLGTTQTVTGVKTFQHDDGITIKTTDGTSGVCTIQHGAYSNQQVLFNSTKQYGFIFSDADGDIFSAYGGAANGITVAADLTINNVIGGGAGYIKIKRFASSGDQAVGVGFAGMLCFSVAANDPVNQSCGLNSIQASVLQLSNGQTGGSKAGAWMEFLQITDIGTPSTNCAGVGAEDVAGTAELIGVDEAGNETQLTSHRSDGPEWLYDDVNETGNLDLIDYHCQRFLGVVEWVNVSRERRLRRAGVQETTEPGLSTTCHFVESLEDYCRRTGKVKPRLDWAEEQARHQANYDAARETDIRLQQEAQQSHAEAQALADARHDVEVATAAKLGLQPPVKHIVSPPDLKTPRPAIDIRKPKPEWLTRWEGRK